MRNYIDLDHIHRLISHHEFSFYRSRSVALFISLSFSSFLSVERIMLSLILEDDVLDGSEL